MVVEDVKYYIQEKHVPSYKNEVICEYYFEPRKGLTFIQGAQKIASQTGIGSWADVSTLSEKAFKEFAPKVFFLDPKNKIIKIAYSRELFEENNIPQIIARVAGNVLGMDELKNIKLLDISFPTDIVRHHFGPHYGIEGVRQLLNVKNRPLLATSVRPKIGLSAEEFGKVAYDSFIGGSDFFCDDDALTSMKSLSFEKRLYEGIKAQRRAEKETGEKKAFVPNVTAPYSEMVRRSKLAVSSGCSFAIVDAFAVGFSALQDLRSLDLRLAFYGRRSMHASMTRSNTQGISMLVLTKLLRLIGLDMINVGGYTEMKDDVALSEEIEKQIVSEKKDQHRLQEDWLSLKPMFAVCSGAIHPMKVKPLMKAMGKDIVFQVGGAVHGHPRGTIEGAKAMRQAIDAVMNGVSIAEYAKNNPALAEAIKKWK